MIEDSFGLTLRMIRVSRGFTQEELAFKSSLDRTYISLLERGLRIPTISTLFRLSNSLDILPEDFIKMVRTNNENH
ncbi:MAG: helix-turn-helix transcriptional regulator [Ignavibacteriae bacterium]|nr:helix-turn-helix transcriptional regulator [Ignavibacteriota bacterium]